MAKKTANQYKNQINHNVFNTISYWLYLHKTCLIDSLKRLVKRPLGCILTCTVMAIALVLPMLLNLILSNFAKLGDEVKQSAQISLYLDVTSKLENALQLSEQLQNMLEVENVTVISAEQALEQFGQFSGLGHIVHELPVNPLPISLQITPKSTQIDELQNLQQKLQNMPFVEQVQLDLVWIERLNALIALGMKCVFALTVMLILAMLMIVGNTIRLHIENHQHEIEVMNLVGATYAYIRRPFVYLGSIYGFIAGVIAWISVAYILRWLNSGVNALAKLYGSDFMLNNISLEQGLYLVFGAVMLGFIGAWFATTRYLSDLKLK